MHTPEVLTPLRHRQFRLLLGGQAVSGIGDWLDYLGLIVLVAFTWRAGPTGLAVLAVAAAVPWVLVAPFAGVWADRLPSRSVLIGCDLARAAVVLAYLLAPNLPVLLLLVVLKTAAATLFIPAEQVLLRSVVPPSELLAANALATFVGQAAKVAGPAAGGLVVAAGGPHAAFVVDAATFLASALLLAMLPATPRSAAGPEERERMLPAVRAGLAVIAGSRTLALAVGAMSATVFLVFTFDTLSPLALVDLGLDTTELGLGMAAVGLGAVLGTVALGQYGQRWHPLRLMGGSLALVGLLVGGLGAAARGQVQAPALVWFVVLAGVGGGTAGLLVTYPYVLQRETPEALMGRVAATAFAVVTAMQLVAPPVGGALANQVGVGATFLLGGTGLLALGGVLSWAATRVPAAPPPAAPPAEAVPPEPDGAEVVAHSALPPAAGTARPATPARPNQPAYLW